jgi:hypothetical protein
MAGNLIPAKDPWSLALRGNPDGPIDSAAADGPMPLGQDLTWCSLDAVFLVRAVEVIWLPEQTVQHPGSAVGRADLSRDDRGGVAHPVDAAIRLPHRWAQTTADAGLAVFKRLGPKLTALKLGHGLNHTPDSSLGDFVTVEAALRDGLSTGLELMRRPDRSCVHIADSFQDGHTPDLLVHLDSPIER